MKEDIEKNLTQIKDLIENIKETSKEKNVLNELLLAIEKINEKIDSYYKDLEDYIDSVDSDLLEVKREIYGINEDIDEFNDEVGNDEIKYIEVMCDNCKETIFMDEDLVKNHCKIHCPSCQNILNQ